MKKKKIILAALAASLLLSSGSITAFAAENAIPDACLYVCVEGEDCRNGSHGGDCPVAECENHSEHCAGMAGTHRRYSSRQQACSGRHHGSAGGHHSSAGRHHGSSGRHH